MSHKLDGLHYHIMKGWKLMMSEKQQFRSHQQQMHAFSQDSAFLVQTQRTFGSCRHMAKLSIKASSRSHYTMAILLHWTVVVKIQDDPANTESCFGGRCSLKEHQSHVTKWQHS